MKDVSLWSMKGTYMNEFGSTDYALAYQEKVDRIPHRKEGKAVLLEVVSQDL